MCACRMFARPSEACLLLFVHLSGGGHEVVEQYCDAYLSIERGGEAGFEGMVVIGVKPCCCETTLLI